MICDLCSLGGVSVSVIYVHDYIFFDGNPSHHDLPNVNSNHHIDEHTRATATDACTEDVTRPTCHGAPAHIL